MTAPSAQHERPLSREGHRRLLVALDTLGHLSKASVISFEYARELQTEAMESAGRAWHDEGAGL